MSGLWPFALEIYGRPGVEATLLELQDAHGQCVPFLLWALWLDGDGRVADTAALTAGADLARAWQDAAVTPLRNMRRSLKHPSPKAPKRAWDGLRNSVRALELDAERRLLEMLEAASPAPTGAATYPLSALSRAVSAWGEAAPPGLLARLAQAAA